MIDNKSYKLMLDMELNETKNIDTLTHIIRVPGGWIYCTAKNNGTTQTFISEVPELEQPANCLDCINSYNRTVENVDVPLIACSRTNEIVWDLYNNNCKDYKRNKNTNTV